MPTVNGYIKSITGGAVPSASVQILDGNFDRTGEGTAANSAGAFSLSVDPYNEPYAMQITSIGYKSKVVPLSSWQNGSIITLEISAVTNENVTVYSTAGKKPFPLWLLAVPVAIYAMDEKKGKQVSGVKEIFSGLPPWAKGVLAVGGGFVAYSVVNKILKSRKEQNEPRDAGNEVNVLASQGIYPSYTDAQYESFCNAIVQAIWDCGTDETAIYNVMRSMRNDADIYKLISVYGVRKYKGCFEGFFSLVERSLSGAISSELDAGEKSKVNSILRDNGITFQFT